MPSKIEQSEIVKVIGTRLREARELCNMSQSVAATRFGYANSSKLAKVENATDTNSAPVWLILRASEVYEVSVDYLLGAGGYWCWDWEEAKRCIVDYLGIAQ